MDPLTTAAERYLQAGLLGALVVVFAGVIYVLWMAGNRERDKLLASIAEAQQARIADAQATTARLIEVVRECTTSMNSVASATEAQQEAMRELRTTLKDFGDDLRSRR